MILYEYRALYQRTGDVKTYPEIASYLLGDIWSPIVKLATVVSCLGSCTSYIIFFAELCSQIFNISFLTSIGSAIIPLVLLSWIRTFRELSLFTLIGVIAIAASVFVIIMDGYNTYTLTDDTNIRTFSLIIPASIMNFVGPATFIFTIHYCVLAMGSEVLLENPWLSLNSNNLNSRRTHSKGSHGGRRNISVVVPSVNNGHTVINGNLNNNEKVPLLPSALFPSALSDSSISTNTPTSTPSRRHPLLSPFGIEDDNDGNAITDPLVKPLATAYILSGILISLLGVSGYILYDASSYVR